MKQEELLRKLDQIEEQAREALTTFPALTTERLRMIIALTRYVRTEVQHARVSSALASADQHPSENDDDNLTRSA